MKTFSKYLAMLIALLATGTAVSTESLAGPLDRAWQNAELAGSSPHNPAPAVPASDIVDRQRDARTR